jgi:transcriptional regulator with XRE-family HTH domain
MKGHEIRRSEITAMGKRIQAAFDKDLLDISKEMGIAYKTLWRFVSGYTPPPLWFLLKAAKATGKTLDWLLRGDESSTVSDKDELDYLRQIRKAQTLEVADEIKGYIRFKLQEAEKTATKN